MKYILLTLVLFSSTSFALPMGEMFASMAYSAHQQYPKTVTIRCATDGLDCLVGKNKRKVDPISYIRKKGFTKLVDIQQKAIGGQGEYFEMKVSN